MNILKNNWKSSLWALSLALFSALLTFKFACATPFAALAAIAALSLPRRVALSAIVGAWALNQFIGYGALDYPLENQSVLWGAMMGAATLLALLVAQRTAAAVAAPQPRAGAVLLASMTSYQLGLFALANLLADMVGGFSRAVVLEVSITNVLSFALMYATYRALNLAGLQPTFDNAHTLRR